MYICVAYLERQWWRQDMKTLSALLALWLSSRRASNASFDVFFDVGQNKLLTVASALIETLCRPYDAILMTVLEMAAWRFGDWDHFDGLAQHCSISSALAVKILQSCIKPSIWSSTIVWDTEKHTWVFIIYQNSIYDVLANAICKMTPDLLRPQCVKRCLYSYFPCRG